MDALAALVAHAARAQDSLLLAAALPLIAGSLRDCTAQAAALLPTAALSHLVAAAASVLPEPDWTSAAACHGSKLAAPAEMLLLPGPELQTTYEAAACLPLPACHSVPPPACPCPLPAGLPSPRLATKVYRESLLAMANISQLLMKPEVESGYRNIKCCTCPAPS